MTAVQLATLYDENPDITVEMLASNFGYEVEAVKLELSASSKRFRKELKKDEDDCMFTADEKAAARRAIMDLIQYSEVDAVKGRMAQFVLTADDNKAAAAKKHIGGNINVINIHVQKAREALARSKGIVQEVTDVKELQAA
jgi:hypothetical protein